MRLTLRTLLAYLDDTLPSNEIKAIPGCILGYASTSSTH